jgi:hypothetical protein
MAKKRAASTNTNGDLPDNSLPEAASPEAAPQAVPEPESKEDAKATDFSWPVFLQSAKTQEVKQRVSAEIGDILARHGVDRYCVLALMEPDDSIDSTDLDQIFSALTELNPDRSKDVLLLLLSRGGSIEPAYQISKLCKTYSNQRFIAVIPRHAKSAATLIAIGADEIHMGPLGQLGPIDPQLGGLPALGVSQALKTIASVAEGYPKSAEMLAKYLQAVLTVEQIGYCDRISESAVQYAVRLLSTKPGVSDKAGTIAKELVHEYKDHGFVIDLDEAQRHLGADWVKSDTAELEAAEEIYSFFDMVNFILGFTKNKRMIVTGGAALQNSVLLINKKTR